MNQGELDDRGRRQNKMLYDTLSTVWHLVEAEACRLEGLRFFHSSFTERDRRILRINLTDRRVIHVNVVSAPCRASRHAHGPHVQPRALRGRTGASGEDGGSDEAAGGQAAHCTPRRRVRTALTRVQTCLKRLYDLGSLLYFNDVLSLKGFVIVDPLWLFAGGKKEKAPVAVKNLQPRRLILHTSALFYKVVHITHLLQLVCTLLSPMMPRGHRGHPRQIRLAPISSSLK